MGTDISRPSFRCCAGAPANTQTAQTSVVTTTERGRILWFCRNDRGIDPNVDRTLVRRDDRAASAHNDALLRNSDIDSTARDIGYRKVSTAIRVCRDLLFHAARNDNLDF